MVVADFRPHSNHSHPPGKLGYQIVVRRAAQNQRRAPWIEAGQNHPTQLQTTQLSDLLS